MKIHAQILSIVIGMALVGSAAQASVTVTLINSPVGDGLFSEDGVTGYQYIWDVHTTGDAPASVSFLGFDGSQVAWVRTHPYYQTTGTWQQWGNLAGGSNTDGINGDEVASPSTNDGSGDWRDSLDIYGDFVTPGDPFPWAMTNTWHLPGDYAAGAAAFMPTTAGLLLTSGLKWDGTWNNGDLSHDAGLMLTIRVVHPVQPGVMGWETSEGQSGTTTGPIPEPATLGLLALGGVGLLRRKRLRSL